MQLHSKATVTNEARRLIVPIFSAWPVLGPDRLFSRKRMNGAPGIVGGVMHVNQKEPEYVRTYENLFSHGAPQVRRD